MGYTVPIQEYSCTVHTSGEINPMGNDKIK